MSWLTLVAFSPIILLIILLLLRVSLSWIAPFALVYTLGMSMLLWQILPLALAGALAKGAFLALDIFLIILGALLFIDALRKKGILADVEHYLFSISKDSRVQVLLLVWFFGSFIEGAAGFGTPAAIVAPLLVSLGYPIARSIALALVANSTAVVFGAVGTPINVGLSGLATSTLPVEIAGTNLLIGIFVPIALMMLLVRRDQLFRSIPLALFAGLCLTLPMLALSYLGPEFPSLIGSVIGGVVFVFGHTLFVKKIIHHKEAPKSKGSLKRALIPYVVLVALLLLGKFFAPARIVELGGATHTFSLANPGIAFILTLLLTGMLPAMKKTAKSLVRPALVIFSISALVQLMILTGNNLTGYASMVQTIGSFLPSIAPLTPALGALGAFLTGSATVSLLLFGQVVVVGGGSLALLVIGAGLGNMISLTNIIAVQAAVKHEGHAMEALQLTFIPCIVYILIATLLALV